MSGLFDLDTYNEREKDIIGVGAIGGHLCKLMSYMAIEKVCVWDPEVVEDVNVGPQGFRPEHLGCLKVEARAADWNDNSPDAPLSTAPRRWRYSDRMGIVFCCVDTLKTRRFITDKLKSNNFSGWFIDARMMGYSYEVYAINFRDIGCVTRLEETLSSDGLTTGSCTTRSTLHAASTAASLMLSVSMHALLRPVPFKISGDHNMFEQKAEY